MNPKLQMVFLLFLIPSLLFPAALWSFSFSEHEANEAASDTVSAHPPGQLHCPKSLKTAKIATMIGEIQNDTSSGMADMYGSFLPADAPEWHGSGNTRRSAFGNLVDSLNQGFQQLGLRTYTAAEINTQIARVEQEAVLNNDLDAAISAADRLSAAFVVKGIISAKSQTNKVINIDEVFVTIDLSLLDRNGNLVSSAQVGETQFSDADVVGTIQKLVKSQASHITYQLFKDYCQGGN